MAERIAVLARLSGGLVAAEGAGDGSFRWVSLPCLAPACFDGRDVTERTVFEDGAESFVNSWQDMLATIAKQHQPAA